MKNFFIFILFLCSLFAFSAPTFSQTRSQSNAYVEPQKLSEAIHWHEWSNETFELAQQQNKLVLLDIGASWCKFCKKMEAVTYQDAEVINIIKQHYIAIKADIEEAGDVQILYGNFGVPGTIILNAEKDEINKRLGYISVQQMQWHLLGSIQDASSTSISSIDD